MKLNVLKTTTLKPKFLMLGLGLACACAALTACDDDDNNEDDKQLTPSTYGGIVYEGDFSTVAIGTDGVDLGAKGTMIIEYKEGVNDVDTLFLIQALFSSKMPMKMDIRLAGINEKDDVLSAINTPLTPDYMAKSWTAFPMYNIIQFAGSESENNITIDMTFANGYTYSFKGKKAQ